MFGDETDEAAQAQRRLNDALNDSLTEIFNHNEASKDRAEWIPLSQVTLLRCTGKAFEGVFTTLIPFWLAKEKKLIK